MRWLKNGQTHEYEATNQDALTLARAVAREGAPRDAVAWTLVQRFAFLYPAYKTLAAFVSAYAQPINPLWFPDGRKHKARMRQLEGNEAAQADELRRARNRVEYARVPWEELPAAARTAALEAIEAHGESPVPGAVHFRASKAPKGASKRQAFERAQRYASGRADLVDVVRIPQGYGPGVNWFFQAPGSTQVRMLADDDDPLVATPSPKGQGPGFPPPPDGLPQGEGWGWAWCYSPSPLSPPESAEDAEQGDTSSPPQADQEGPQEGDQEAAEADDDGDELPPGPVLTLDRARRELPELADELAALRPDLVEDDDDDDDELDQEAAG